MKGLADIIGHKEIVRTLRNAVEQQKAAHAYLFSGKPGLGKRTTAMAFAMALLCASPCNADACNRCKDCQLIRNEVHPDLYVIKPDGASIKIHQVRQLQRTVLLSPHQGRGKIYILEQADTMTAEAANSLLKTLEEPPAGVVCILLTEKPYSLLPTVISRCQQLFFHPMGIREIGEGLAGISGISDEDIRLSAALSGGSLGKALALAAQGQHRPERDNIIEFAMELRGVNVGGACRMAEELSADKAAALTRLELLLMWYRDLLIWRETGCGDILINQDMVHNIEKEAVLYTTGRLIDIISSIELTKGHLSANANTRLALEILFMRLAG